MVCAYNHSLESDRAKTSETVAILTSMHREISLCGLMQIEVKLGENWIGHWEAEVLNKNGSRETESNLKGDTSGVATNQLYQTLSVKPNTHMITLVGMGISENHALIRATRTNLGNTELILSNSSNPTAIIYINGKLIEKEEEIAVNILTILLTLFFFFCLSPTFLCKVTI